MSKRNNDSRGFTLIELTVSVALLALLTFGVVELFPRGLQLTQRAEALTIAANLAQDGLEIVVSKDYVAVNPGVYETRHPVWGSFERETNITFLDPTTLAASSDDTGLKKAEVTAFYQTRFGEKTFVLSTLIARL